MNKLSELKAAAMAATPGPWTSLYDDWSDGDDALISCESRDGMVAIAKIEGGGFESGYDEPFSSEQQANAAFIAAANPAAVLELLAERDADKKRITDLEAIATDYADKFQKAQDATKHLIIMNDKDKKRIAELDRSETQLIDERDSAHAALDDMYEAVTGKRPEWSNWFGFADAIEEVELIAAGFTSEENCQ
ncbi:ead/Ea22-like family protein [Serratia liquefaciens]|uniref:ead/Ea22-like family protein n=1 Tax=Serratia liquefaciens TaxID=614 RepID=UPI0021833A44|nr:ead/Ea22-like family protein [Serratia liquefaciens]CAI2521432.1 Uncharacterised protein [Serratia liquefaciens]